MFWKKKAATPPPLPPRANHEQADPQRSEEAANLLESCLTEFLASEAHLKETTKEPMRLGKGHPGTFEGPTNRLEEVFMAYRNREIPFSVFFTELLNSDVCILSTGVEMSSPQPDATTPREGPRATNLFCLNHPEYSALAIYTSRERTKPTTDLYPDFRYCSTIVTGALLAGFVNSGCGLVINPYWDVNTELDNEQMEMLLGALQHH